MLFDQVNDRIEIPYGSRHYITKFGHLFFPFEGHIGGFWKSLFKYKGHSEGDVYLGLAFAITLLICIYLAIKLTLRQPYYWLKSKRFILLIVLPIMFVAMGIHEDLFSLFSSTAINKTFAQFRSLARLSWLFYFIITPYLAYRLYHLIYNLKPRNLRMILLSLVFLSFGLDLFDKLQTVHKNIDKYSRKNPSTINYSFVNEYEFQAALCLPNFHIGSEKLNINSAYSNSVNNGFLLSLNTGIPLMNTMLSRTSISQTYKQLKMLSSDSRNSAIDDLNSNKPLLLIISKNQPYLPRTKEFIKASKRIYSTNSIDFRHLIPNHSSQVISSNQHNRSKNIYSSEKRIASTNYIKKETVEVCSISINEVKYDSVEIRIQHDFTNKIYSFPEVIVNDNNPKPLSKTPFEFSNGDIVFIKQEKLAGDELSVKLKGVGIGVNKVEIWLY